MHDSRTSQRPNSSPQPCVNDGPWDDQTWKPTIACSNQAMLLLQRHVFSSLLALKPVACPTMCPQTFVPFRPRPPLPRGAWATRIHGGLGDAASRLSSWPAQGDAAILDATPTVSLQESSRNVVNWSTRNGRSRDARNRTSQSGDPGEKTPGGAGTHRHTGHTRLSNLTTNPSTHQHAHARPRHDPGDDRTTRPTQSR
jgi:hypothetical protein